MAKSSWDSQRAEIVEEEEKMPDNGSGTWGGGIKEDEKEVARAAAG